MMTDCLLTSSVILVPLIPAAGLITAWCVFWVRDSVRERLARIDREKRFRKEYAFARVGLWFSIIREDFGSTMVINMQLGRIEPHDVDRISEMYERMLG